MTLKGTNMDDQPTEIQPILSDTGHISIDVGPHRYSYSSPAELVRLATLGAEFERRVLTKGSAEVIELIMDIHKKALRQREGSTAVNLKERR